MRRRFGFLAALAFLLALACGGRGADQAAGPGTGHLDEWVSNGQIKVQVSEVRYLRSSQEVHRLSWNPAFLATPEARALFTKAGNCFRGQSHLLLFRLALRNMGGKAISAGVATPVWRVNGSDGREYGIGACEKTLSANLMDGLPARYRLPPGGEVGGLVAFLMPSGAKAATLTFTGGLSRDHGAPGSVVVEFTKK